MLDPLITALDALIDYHKARGRDGLRVVLGAEDQRRLARLYRASNVYNTEPVTPDVLARWGRQSKGEQYGPYPVVVHPSLEHVVGVEAA